MKMISSTSMTSTSGVTLMSAIDCSSSLSCGPTPKAMSRVDQVKLRPARLRNSSTKSSRSDRQSRIWVTK